MAIFSLNEVKIKQVENVAYRGFSGWPENGVFGFNDTGYIYGGAIPPVYVSSVLRFDFSNEVMRLTTNTLDLTRGDTGLVSNEKSAYILGGFGTAPLPPVTTSTVARFDYSSNSTSVLSSSMPLSATSPYTGMQSSSCGYSTVNLASSSCVRLTFENETITVVGNVLPTVVRPTCSKNAHYGYMIGGYLPPTIRTGVPVSSLSRMDFSTEVVSNLSPLSISRWWHSTAAATGGDGLYSYLAAGTTAGGITAVSNIVRFDFTSESITTTGSNLPVSLQDAATMASPSYGYFVGGTRYPQPGARISSNSRLDFSSGTVSTSTVMPATRIYFQSYSNSL